MQETTSVGDSAPAQDTDAFRVYEVKHEALREGYLVVTAIWPGNDDRHASGEYHILGNTKPPLYLCIPRHLDKGAAPAGAIALDAEAMHAELKQTADAWISSRTQFLASEQGRKGWDGRPVYESNNNALEVWHRSGKCRAEISQICTNTRCQPLKLKLSLLQMVSSLRLR